MKCMALILVLCLKIPDCNCIGKSEILEKFDLIDNRINKLEQDNQQLTLENVSIISHSLSALKSEGNAKRNKCIPF